MNNRLALPATLHLEQMRCYAYHGVLPQETQVGAWYTLELQLELTLSELALLHDDLRGTINYAEAFAIVQQIMARPALLIERVAFTIVEALLLHFDSLTAVAIALRKDTPPMGGNLQGASVHFRLSREQLLSYQAHHIAVP